MRPVILVSVQVLLLAAVSAYGQCPPDSPENLAITGRVVAPGFNYDRYVEVLQLNETQLIGWGYTNSTGIYRLPAQPPGQYYVIVRLDGFKEYRERLNIFGCSGQWDHTFFLDPEEEEIPPVILDFTGEVKEVVDIAELKRNLPKRVVDEFEKARAERLRGESDRARQRLEKLLNQAPDFYDAHNALGSVYLEAKRFREAEAEYNRARELRPASAAPLVSLGSLYMQEADAARTPPEGVVGVLVSEGDLGVILDDARSILDAAIRLKPDASFAYYLRGINYTLVGSYVKAEQDLRRALELETRLRWARIGLANLYMKQNKWAEALREFDIYLEDYKKVANRTEVQETRKRVAAQVVSTGTN